MGTGGTLQNLTQNHYSSEVSKTKTLFWWPVVKAKKPALLKTVDDYVLRWRRRLFDVVPAVAEDSVINLRILQVRPEKPEILHPPS